MRQNPGGAAPTMIIPGGTDIQVDTHGQLSIRAPGNLVIQNSGKYGTVESLNGSIRIEPKVDVEAVIIRCADTVYVEGSLTAWRVSAKCLHLEDAAEAHVVLQETDRLEIGGGARLVGNFSSEKELVSLFSRFAQQLRSLPFYPTSGRAEQRLAPDDTQQLGEGRAEGQAKVPTGEEGELPDDLFFALVLLERDTRRGQYDADSQRVLQELTKLLRTADLETLQHTYRTLFRRVNDPGEDVRRAAELVDGYYGGRQGAARTSKPSKGR